MRTLLMNQVVSSSALEYRRLAKSIAVPAVDGLDVCVRGIRQNVSRAGSLCHVPRLIILDDPFTWLDAGSARFVRSVLRYRFHAGCSVIMTTHILEVAERMADRIGVMVAGRLFAEGTLEELRRQAGAGHATLEDTFLALVATIDTGAARGPIDAC